MGLYDKDYYINSKTSNYENYLELPRDEMADELISLLDIKSGSSILDFGCACGNLLYELDKKLNNVNLFGADISEWAIQQAEKREYVNRIIFNNKYPSQFLDHVFALDVLEHMPDREIYEFFYEIKGCTNLIVRIPIARGFEGRYVLGVSEKDTTHIQRMTRNEWLKIFSLFGYKPHKFIDMKTIYDTDAVLCVWLKGDFNE